MRVAIVHAICKVPSPATCRDPQSVVSAHGEPYHLFSPTVYNGRVRCCVSSLVLSCQRTRRGGTRVSRNNMSYLNRDYTPTRR